MDKPALNEDTNQHLERRGHLLLAVSENLESVLESIDMEQEQDLADAVIVAIRAADGAIDREVVTRSGR